MSPLARALVVLLAVSSGCAAPIDPDALEGPSDPALAALAYVEDASLRRRALEASVAVADNAYADLRLARYGGAWETLPVYAPRVRRLRVRGAEGDDADLEEGEIASVDALAAGASLEDWERAGADVFERVPTQIDLALDVLRDRAEAEAAGLRVDDRGIVQGAVEVETEAGWVVALACAACHSAERDGVLVRGVPNERFGLGAILGAGWPRGTVDVTGEGIDNPVRPSDLRPIALQARLHHTGNLANGRVARMVRIETLLVTQRAERARPDRRMVAALSLYLESLERTLPELDRASPGGRLFEATCAGCHAGEALGGAPVPVDVVGTDPRATVASAERSTLGYRAPSLRGVGDRRAVLHDGSAADLDAMLGLAPSSHVGHPFGRHLPEDERRAIARFLRAERE